MSVYTDLSDLAATTESLSIAVDKINDDIKALAMAECLGKEIDKIDDEIRLLINEIESYDEEDLPRDKIAKRLKEIRAKLF